MSEKEDLGPFLATLPRPLSTRVRHAIFVHRVETMSALRIYAESDALHADTRNFGMKSVKDLRRYLKLYDEKRCARAVRLIQELARTQDELDIALAALGAAREVLAAALKREGDA